MASFPLLMIVFALLGFSFAHDAFIGSKNASEFVSSEIDEEAAMQIAALFQENFQQPFSWEDPELLRLLTRELEGSDAKDATQKLSKRVSGTYFSQQTAPILNFPQCVGCANAAQRSWVLEDFTNQFFMDRRLIAPENLVDKCVFYTQRPSINIIPGLSEPATVWACNQVPIQWKTIWHLWPSQPKAQQNNPGNFYGLYGNGYWDFQLNRCIAEVDANNNPIQNWLYDIYHRDCEWKANRVANGLPAFDNTQINQGPQNIFFSLMSQAMAQSCRGRVYVLTDNPRQMPTAGIWGLVEWPTLVAQARAGQISRVTAVAWPNFDAWVDLDLTQNVQPYNGWTPPLAPKDMAHTFNQTGDTFDWSEHKEHSRGIREHEKEFRARLLQSRDACDLATSNEPAGHDFFGWGN